MTYPTLIIDNFIDDKDFDILIESFNNAAFNAGSNNPNLFSYNIPSNSIHRPMIDLLNSKLCSTLERIYNKSITKYTGGGVARYKEGQNIDLHADWAPEDDYVKTQKKEQVSISSVFYFNEDFIGGELIFCKDKESSDFSLMNLKPQKGTVIFFDSLKWHYTTPIISGVKYSYTNFYSLEG